MSRKIMDAPLSEEEKAFAEDEHNYNSFFGYMKVHGLNPEEWYDILVIHYLRAVRKYLTIPKLQDYKFEAVLYRTLDNGRSNYFRDMNRQKRKPEGGVFSYNSILEDGKTLEEFLVDVYTNVERQVIFKELFKEFYESCVNCNPLFESDVYKDELDMLLEGYSSKKISKAMQKKYGSSEWALESDMILFRQIFRKVFGI